MAVQRLLLKLSLTHARPHAIGHDSGNQSRLGIGINQDNRPGNARRGLDRQVFGVIGGHALHLRQALDHVEIIRADAIDQRQLLGALGEPDAMGFCGNGSEHQRGNRCTG